MKFCKLDIKKATVNTVLQQAIYEAIVSKTTGRYKYEIIDDNYTIKITGKRSTNPKSPYKIADELVSRINSYKPDILRVVKTREDDQSPILLEVYVNPDYINQKFDSLPEEQKNHVNVDLSRDINFFNGDNSLMEQERKWDSDDELQFQKLNKPKEYTSQALINTKISKLKEVAKKYPRSLIRSEVKSIEQARQPLSYFEDDIPFQKVPVQITEDNKVSVDVLRNDNQSLQEGLNWLKSVNPNVQPEIVQGLIDGIANGSYNSNLDLITLSEEFANKKTVKHEMLHKILASLPFEQREAILNEASKKYGIARGESKTTTKYSQVQQNEINYALKAVDILQSAKGDEIFRKGDKNNWDIDKILQELQIPKQQQNLIKEFNTRNREQILTNLLANYSYTVEINTAKERSGKNDIIDREFEVIYGYKKGSFEEFIRDKFRGEDIEFIKSQIEKNTKSLYWNEYQERRELVNNINTSYYSNLTVPGGINYTEQEISTPLITPSIKGHAQFSTDNGIGWFRSDDKSVGETSSVKEQVVMHEGVPVWTGKMVDISKGGTPTKTRRILEVQSDLFQKGRDKKNLITSLDDKTGYGGNQATAQEYRNTIGGNENQFLQLLNKDSNWVTFFVKSIIQDSAKKGYEKVLFPSGNTASKVEGHTTLE